MQKSDAVVLRTCQEVVVPQVMKIFNCLYFDEIIFDLEVEVGSIPYLVRKS